MKFQCGEYLGIKTSYKKLIIEMKELLYHVEDGVPLQQRNINHQDFPLVQVFWGSIKIKDEQLRSKENQQ